MIVEGGASANWNVKIADAGAGSVKVNLEGRSVYLNGRIRLVVGRGPWYYTYELLRGIMHLGVAPNVSFNLG